MPKVECICQNCGKSFSVYASQIKYGGGKNCSTKCAHASRSQKASVIVPCDICDKPTQRKKFEVKAHNHNVCSRECQAILFKEKRSRPDSPHSRAKRKGPPFSGWRKCKGCSKKFYGRPYQKFCSKECTQNRVTVVCDHCGKIFRRIKAGTGIYKRTFCSNSCKIAFEVGPNASQWKGGTTSKDDRERGRRQYADWRRTVFIRDDYTCQDCGERGGKLRAHHLYEFSKYPELRYVIENGRTLCYKCHRKTCYREKEYRELLFATTPIHIPGA